MAEISKIRFALSGILFAATLIPLSSFAQSSVRPIVRTDGGSITLSTKSARVAGKVGDVWVRQLNANLPNRLDSYTFAEIDAAVARTNDTVGGASIYRLDGQICWNGKRRRWCLGLVSSEI